MFVVLFIVIRLTLAFNHIAVGENNLSFCTLNYIKNVINSNSENFITILLDEYPNKFIENSIKQIQSENILLKTINADAIQNDQIENLFWFYSAINLDTFLQSIKCDNLNESIHIIVCNESSFNLMPFLNRFQLCNLNIFHQINSTSWRIMKIIEQNESKIIKTFMCNENKRNDNDAKNDDNFLSAKNEDENNAKGNEIKNEEEENIAVDEEISTNDHVFENDNETLVVYSLDSPPYMIFEETQGFYDGIEYFALNEIAKQLNMTVRFELLDQAFDLRTLTNYMNLFR